MNKYVIIHSHHEKESRDFIIANPNYQVISWYEDGKDKVEYVSNEMPFPSIFPSVVDTELKLICHNPSSVEQAIIDFNDFLNKEQERKIKEIRTIRDSLLMKSDFAVLGDSPFSESEKTAIMEYRQALRDITNQVNFPNDVVWPTRII